MSFDKISLEKLGSRFIVIIYGCQFVISLLGLIILINFTFSGGILALFSLPLLILGVIGNFLIYYSLFHEIKRDELW